MRTRSLFDKPFGVDLIGFRSMCCIVVELTSTGVWWLKMTGVVRWPCHLACSFGDISVGGFAGPQHTNLHRDHQHCPVFYIMRFLLVRTSASPQPNLVSLSIVTHLLHSQRPTPVSVSGTQIAKPVDTAVVGPSPTSTSRHLWEEALCRERYAPAANGLDLKWLCDARQSLG